MGMEKAAKVWEKLRKPPTRLGIAIMMFLSCLVSYMMRVNLSINIIAMVASNDPNVTMPDYGHRYDWSQKDQSWLLGAYFYGYMVTNLCGGILASWAGGRNLIGYTTIASAVLTVLTPYCPKWNFWLLFVIRLIIGVLGGVLFPTYHHLISKWAPPDEKGKFVSSLMGGTFGTVITWPLCGALTENLGYAWSFHITAIIATVVGILWFFIVADSPDKHPRITPEEQDYITDSLKDVLTKSSRWPPCKHLMMSLPFWGLMILHYGNMWGLFFLLTAAPKFMGEVLGFKLSDAGFLSSLPYLARLIMAFVFGEIGDTLKKKKLLSNTAIRKIFTIFSHFIPGLLLIVMALFGKSSAGCVALITLSLGVNGAATITNLQNSQDLSPNYAGTLYGLINFVGTTPGFFAPMIVAYFTRDSNTMKEWMYVFLTGAGVYIVPAIVFLIIGSGAVQYWNDLGAEETKKEEVKEA